MGKIDLKEVKKKIKETFIEINHVQNSSVASICTTALENESSERGRSMLEEIVRNSEIARDTMVPLCQDTGLAIIHAEVGESCEFEYHGFESIEHVLKDAVREAYRDGYLRKSVCNPFTRENNNTNLPPFIVWKLVKGSALKFKVMSKGGGSENKSTLRMLSPSDGLEGIEDFVIRSVREAGPDACPPFILGLGIGGNFETAPLLAKKALMRLPAGSSNPDPFIADIEKRLLAKVNALDIGPFGYGGSTTAFAVHVEAMECHIASLPVALNINCHSHRVKQIIFGG